MGHAIDDEMLHAFAVVAEPEHLAAKLTARWKGLADRISFYAPYRSDPTRWRKVLLDLKAA